MNRPKFRPFFWVRIGKKRLGIVPAMGDLTLFSERYGFVKVWRVFGYKIKLRDSLPTDPLWFGSWWAYPLPPTR